MEFLIHNNPSLADGIKNQIAQQIKQTSPSQSGFFPEHIL